jgi:hypothetical protein
MLAERTPNQKAINVTSMGSVHATLDVAPHVLTTGKKKQSVAGARSERISLPGAITMCSRFASLGRNGAAADHAPMPEFYW